MHSMSQTVVDFLSAFDKSRDSPDRSDCNLCVRLFVSDRSEKSEMRSFILSGLSWDVSEWSVSGLRPFWHTGTWTGVQHGGSR